MLLKDEVHMGIILWMKLSKILNYKVWTIAFVSREGQKELRQINLSKLKKLITKVYVFTEYCWRTLISLMRS